ncbi:amidohydrolase family protein [Mycobacteroides saopaulense]|uniref:Amidohydrolase n=1 Tax=Mycobacteroides saopaulense TaxID=1578165 RepID=A0ABX3C284_9MYCO|nr:amidohydrolase family protein [Mycobacteroides saopaulense]OHT85035.1 amidohydrolase [Mycobacteroides saopaulense]OHU11187.1 amidohydrolase [Mycobacteroides saopaulense]
MPNSAFDPAPIRQIWQQLGIPGIVDVHTHFMPKSVMDKVWAYFDSAGPLVGRPWPITYRAEESQRVATLREFGLLCFTSLIYPHKPQMAAWLNQWAAQFAAQTPDCIHTATFFPEPEAFDYTRAALDAGVRVFKVHIQVGAFSPTDPLLKPVWGLIEDAGVPVVIHCGSGPAAGEFTGPDRVRALLKQFPRLRLIVAHMGMPEYTDFLDLAEEYDDVRLDTTMAFTDFSEEKAPFPQADYPRLRHLGHKILFGSDFPNIPYGYTEAITALQSLPGVDDDWMRAVLYRNGAGLFGIGG